MPIDFGGLLDWLFTPLSAAPLQFARCLLGLAFVFDTLTRWRDRHILFGHEGYATWNKRSELKGLQWTALEFMPRKRISVDIVFSALILSALAMAAGFGGGISVAIAYACVISLHNANPSANGSESLLAKNLCFLFMFVPAGPLTFAGGGIEFGKRETVPRLLEIAAQFLVCMVYFQTYMTKISNTNWPAGTALSYALRHPYLGRLKHFRFMSIPLYTRVPGYAALIIQGIFPLLVLFEATRIPTVLAMMIFHAGMALFLRVGIFSAFMIAALSVFLPAPFGA